MTLFEDVRFGLRTLGKNPGFTVIAVIALALGIGTNATVFGITNGVLFKNMPFMSDRVFYISTKNLTRGQNRSGVSYPDFRDWRDHARSFDSFGAFNFDVVNVSDKVNVPTRYNLGRITANTFSVIGQKPTLGRDFGPDDERVGAVPVAIIGYGIWENRFGKNPAIVGQTIKVNDVVTTVVGVMQRDLRFPIDSDFWVPLVPTADSEKRQLRNLTALARCRRWQHKNRQPPKWKVSPGISRLSTPPPIKASLPSCIPSARRRAGRMSGCWSCR
jgi:hypothetical protein